MLLKIGSDAREVAYDLDAKLPQVGSSPNAGAKQHGRRAQRAGRQDDLATAHNLAVHLDPNGAGSVHHELRDGRADRISRLDLARVATSR